MAVHRKCKYCGRPISIRQMPAGHWVAFDLGTDNVHDCEQEPAMQTLQSERKHSFNSVSRVPASASYKTGSINGSKPISTPDRASDIQNVNTDPVVATSYREIRRLLEKALREHHCVKLVYYTAYRHALTERVIEPIELEQGPLGSTILRAYCRWRKDVRSFALSNIRRAELLDETFDPTIAMRATSSERTRDVKETNWMWWLVVAGIICAWAFFGR